MERPEKKESKFMKSMKHIDAEEILKRSASIVNNNRKGGLSNSTTTTNKKSVKFYSNHNK